MARKYNVNDDRIQRFSAYRIFEHGLHIVIFVILVITGLSQKYYYLSVSQWTILMAGGIDAVRIIHRLTGMTFFFLTAIHMIIAIAGITMRRWQPSMVITKKDFRDAVLNIKYYIGIVDRPARCDRYSYKQKFEYWSILIGVVMMIFSGLTLWFPTTATRYFPGVIIPAAKALHTNGALFIVLIIAIWHVYNSIFSPEVFPLDTTIFSGTISRDRMNREHPLELERINEIRERSEEPYARDGSIKFNA